MEPATGEVSDPDFTTHLAVASRMVGAAPADLLAACALNGWGAPGARVYQVPANFSVGDWLYMPATDALGVVNAVGSADPRYLTIRLIEEYRAGPQKIIDLPQGQASPSSLRPESHGRAYGFCLPGCRRSEAFLALCANLPDRLADLGYLEIDGQWLIDVDRSLLADFRSRGPLDRSFAEELLRRRLDAVDPVAPSSPWERFRWLLTQSGLSRAYVAGTGIILAGDWLVFPDDAFGFVDSLPKPLGTELIVSVSVYPLGPLGPNGVERREVRFSQSMGRAAVLDVFESNESPFMRRRLQISNFILALTGAEPIAVDVEPERPEQDFAGPIKPDLIVEDLPVQVYEFVKPVNKRFRDFSKLRSVFLLDTGWSYRIMVTTEIMDGYDPTLIQSYCDYLGLEVGSDTTYKSSVDGLPSITVSRRKHARRHEAWISGLDGVFDRLGLEAGDYVFIGFQRDVFTIYTRRWQELSDRNALGELLWSCGLDPHDEQLRMRPWGRLARVLGMEGSSREQVGIALLTRSDDYRLDLLDNARADSHVVAKPWPSTWRFLSPKSPGPLFKLMNAEDVRVAIGWANAQDLTGPQRWVTSPDGVVWAQFDAGDRGGLPTDHEIRQLIELPPSGMTAVTDEWIQWACAEHNACRLALVDHINWSLTLTSDGWTYDGNSAAGSLLAALETLPLSAKPARDADFPDHAIPQYPRRALDFRLAERQATRLGLVVLRGVQDVGIRGEFADGRRSEGLTLVQAFG